jgi:hypothetical protein
MRNALYVKIGILCLTRPVKVGYNGLMFAGFISFVLRVWLIAALWACIWRFVKPRTQLMRIFRAALLLLALLGVLALLKITGQ